MEDFNFKDWLKILGIMYLAMVVAALLCVAAMFLYDKFGMAALAIFLCSMPAIVVPITYLIIKLI